MALLYGQSRLWSASRGLKVGAIGENLARVEAVPRVEGLAQPSLSIEIDRAEHVFHKVPLFKADSMLSGDSPSHINTFI